MNIKKTWYFLILKKWNILSNPKFTSQNERIYKKIKTKVFLYSTTTLRGTSATYEQFRRNNKIPRIFLVPRELGQRDSPIKTEPLRSLSGLMSGPGMSVIASKTSIFILNTAVIVYGEVRATLSENSNPGAYFINEILTRIEIYFDFFSREIVWRHLC